MEDESYFYEFIFLQVNLLLVVLSPLVAIETATASNCAVLRDLIAFQVS